MTVKRSFLGLILATLAIGSGHAAERIPLDDRAQWFRHDRFGLFVHFGVYALVGKGEWVQDTGKGMALEAQAHAFDSFASGDRRGAGLGLALVRSFIEMHGGWVALASEPGRGATVTCHLPASAAGQKAA